MSLWKRKTQPTLHKVIFLSFSPQRLKKESPRKVEGPGTSRLSRQVSVQTLFLKGESETVCGIRSLDSEFRGQHGGTGRLNEQGLRWVNWFETGRQEGKEIFIEGTMENRTEQRVSRVPPIGQTCWEGFVRFSALCGPRMSWEEVEEMAELFSSFLGFLCLVVVSQNHFLHHGAPSLHLLSCFQVSNGRPFSSKQKHIKCSLRLKIQMNENRTIAVVQICFDGFQFLITKESKV